MTDTRGQKPSPFAAVLAIVALLVLLAFGAATLFGLAWELGYLAGALTGDLPP
jgi:hypothetical protein